MRYRRLLCIVAVVCLLAVADSLTAFPQSAPSAPPQSNPPAQFNQEQHLKELRARIAGKETAPAEDVFQNIQTLKGMPAGRLLAIMNIGFSKSLGVDCTHCHVAGAWESDERAEKQIARDMWVMTNTINTDHLKKIQNLKGPNPGVNCTTCHRGQVKPALNLN